MATASGTSTVGLQSLLDMPSSEPVVLISMLPLAPSLVKYLGYLSILRLYGTGGEIQVELVGRSMWRHAAALWVPNPSSGTYRVQAVWREAGIPWSIASYTAIPPN